MKTRKFIRKISYAINPSPKDATNRQSFKSFSLPIWVAFAMSISLSFVTNPVRAETTGTEDIQHYMKPQGIENTVGRAHQNTKESSAAKAAVVKKTNQGEHATNSGTDETASPSKESNQDYPAFGVLDKNQDNFISHEEGYSNESLTKNWDKIDTNLDGKLNSDEFLTLKPIAERVEAQKTDHPQEVEQYKNGKYISPTEQIERNSKEITNKSDITK